MTDRIFVDSNVWVYLFTNEDNTKCKIAENFILKNSLSYIYNKLEVKNKKTKLRLNIKLRCYLPVQPFRLPLAVDLIPQVVDPRL
ncbi:hypothetical protein FACS189428_0180 [Clostridia bacterium]|nr:hypothetical protein FACS189428_0180 [Clostridia bacterium]